MSIRIELSDEEARTILDSHADRVVLASKSFEASMDIINAQREIRETSVLLKELVRVALDEAEDYTPLENVLTDALNTLHEEDQAN